MTSRTWLITGSGRGLGLALTERVLDRGDHVVATVRGEHRLPDHERLTVLRLDVRDRAAAFDVVDRAARVTGRLDVLVNNAGHGLVGAVEEVSQEEARDIVDTDLFGALWLTQAAVPVMRRQGGGDIVQISSTGGVGAMPLMGLYNAAKWGLEGFSEALAAEVSGFGIRVCLAEPGSMDTAWATGSMRFATPDPVYDGLRAAMFGSAEVPWPVEPGATGGGTPPAAVAEEIVRHVLDPEDGRLRLLLGDDAPGQVAAVLRQRRADYATDERYSEE